MEYKPEGMDSVGEEMMINREDEYMNHEPSSSSLIESSSSSSSLSSSGASPSFSSSMTTTSIPATSTNSSSSLAVASSTDLLWECVMNHISERNRLITSHPSSNWREAFPTKSECSGCTSKGGGALVKCSFDKCKKEYHVECGYRMGGFTIEDNKEIIFYCDLHYKAVTFCKCNRPYDVKTSAAMVCCDECIEWFHYDCVGLTTKQAQALDNYVCKSCSQLRPSKQLRQVNIDKEKRSAQQQEAIKSFSVLVEVAESVCPLIDQFSKNSLQLLDSEDEVYTPDQMIEAADYLSGVPFVPASSTAEPDRVDFFGSLDLINQWCVQLKAYKQKFNSWLSQVKKLISDAKKALIPKISSEYSSVLGKFIQRLNELVISYPIACASSVLDSVSSTEPSPEAANRLRRNSHRYLPVVPVIESALFWFDRFLKILVQEHSAGGNDCRQWESELASHFSSLTSLNKHLARTATEAEEDYFLDFIDLCKNHSEFSARFLKQLMPWAQQANDILEGANSEISIESLVDFIADGTVICPSLPYISILSNVVTSAIQLNDQIREALSQTSMTSTTYEELQTLFGSCVVQIPFAEPLSVVGQRLHFLENFGSMIDQARIPAETMHQLHEVAAELIPPSEFNEISSDPTRNTVLASALEQEILTARTKMDELVSEVTPAATRAHEIILSRAFQTSDVAELLNSLRQHRIISEEENVLEFIQNGQELLVNGRSIMLRERETTLEELGLIEQKLNQLLDYSIPPEFEGALAEFSAQLSHLHVTLRAEESEARSLWADVQKCIKQCNCPVDRGIVPTLKKSQPWARRSGGVTAEKFDLVLNSALQTKFIDQGIYHDAVALLKVAEEITARCKSTLQNIENSGSYLIDVESLLDLSCTAPLDQHLTDSLNRRFIVMSTFQQCSSMLSMSSGLSESAPNDDQILSTRKLRTSLQELLGHAKSLDDAELRLLSTVADEFKLLAWRQEAAYFVCHPAHEFELSAASDLLNSGEVIGELALASPQYFPLKQAVHSALELERSGKNIIAQFDEAVQLTNNILAISDKPSHPANFQLILEAMAVWEKSNCFLLDSISDFFQTDNSLIFRQLNLRDKLGGVHDAIEVVNQAWTICKVLHHINSDADAMDISSSVELKDLTKATNSIQLFVSKSTTFQLTVHLAAYLLQLYREAVAWNEKAEALCLSKMQRSHLKAGASVALPTTGDIQAMLDQDICKNIELPMASKLVDLLASCANIQSLIEAFFRCQEDSAPMPQDLDYQQELFGCVSKVGELQAHADSLQVDIPEMKVLEWMMSVLLWMQAVPPPHSDPKTFSISLETARLRVKEADEYMNVAGLVRDFLQRWNVTSADQDGPLQLTSQARQNLRQFCVQIDYLKQRIEETEHFQLDVRNSIATSKPEEVLSFLYSRIAVLLVVPDIEIRRSLETVLKRGKIGTGGKADDEIDGTDLSKKRKLGVQDETVAKKGPGVKKSKFTFQKCAVTTCNLPAITGSSYCSGACASGAIPSLFQALLVYRSMLLVGTHSRGISNDEDDIAAAFQADISSFRSIVINAQLAAKEVTEAFQQGNFIPSEVDLQSQSVESTDPLRSLLNTSMDQDISNSSVPAIPSVSHHMTAGITALLGALPAISNQVLKGEDVDENGTVTSPRPMDTGGGTADVRKMVRLSFEEIFVISLHRTHTKGAASLGAVLAIELETELFNKYFVFPSAQGASSTKPEFNKKDYRKHQLMLQRNLKQSHNDTVILRLALMEMSIETLLNMTAEQLADSSIMTLRQQQKQAAMLESQRNDSTRQEMEARARETLLGNETWRSKGDGTDSIEPASMSRDVTISVTSSSSSKPVEDNSSEAGISSVDKLRPTSPLTGKRSINVDIGSRFTTSRPKLYKPPEAESMAAEPIAPLSKVSPKVAEESKPKTVNLLELLKSNTKTTPAVSSPKESPVKPSPSLVMPFYLISSTGSKLFFIVRPGAPQIECVGLTFDRRIEGLVRNIINIEGRTRIAELDKFLNEVIAHGKKIVTTYRFYVSGSLEAANPYRKLCDEYTRDGRAGVSNISKDTQIYVIPPKLKSQITIFSTEREEPFEDRVLYGIVISREVGPSELVYADLETHDSPRCASPSLFHDATASSVTTPIISSTQPVVQAFHQVNASPAVPAIPAVQVTPAGHIAPVVHAPTLSTTPVLHAVQIIQSTPAIQPGVAPVQAIPATNAPLDYETMKKVASFCAQNGVQAIQAIKQKPNAEIQMPFLFEGRPGYFEFLTILKQLVSAAASSSASSGSGR